ncbi:uncharacterized protein BP5553_07255 [Venustampulla echinocandica]|uniref:Uncharacterized protein n=1 Tax=Venustampulla echinocandica TaxID=2656787 RepID=A0A370TIY2_9HELO|nr:uncharacterized protein BP5553_07255 [Venustampulla echinocandica]RDL35324.1 hypothetical protein BP5553_07255 [Venustampulla echinocandica]
MPSVIEQPAQVSEQMTTETNAVEATQPRRQAATAAAAVARSLAARSSIKLPHPPPSYNANGAEKRPIEGGGL